MISDTPSTSIPGIQKNGLVNIKNEQQINMGLSYALGPFPDEPLLSAIDKTLRLSSSLRRNFTVQNQTKPMLPSTSFGTDCPLQSARKFEVPSRSSPDLQDLPGCSEEITKVKLENSLKYSSSIDDMVDQREESKETFQRTWVETKTTPNGIKSFEIWAEEVCEDTPSMVFILSPSGEVVPFEQLSS